MKKAKKKVRMAAMAPSIGPRKGGKVRGAPGGETFSDKGFGGGKVMDRGKKRG